MNEGSLAAICSKLTETLLTCSFHIETDCGQSVLPTGQISGGGWKDSMSNQ
jgi:hypothetical protein